MNIIDLILCKIGIHKWSKGYFIIGEDVEIIPYYYCRKCFRRKMSDKNLNDLFKKKEVECDE